MKFFLRVIPALVAIVIAGGAFVSPVYSKVVPDAQQLLDSLKKVYAPDARTSIFEIQAITEGNSIVLEGKVDDREKKDAVARTFTDYNIEYSDKIAVLGEQFDKPWALVKLSVASLRTAGKHSAEMATQAIMGTPIKLLEQEGDWFRAQTPDKYIAYIPANSIWQLTSEELDAWKKTKRYIVTAYQTQLTSLLQLLSLSGREPKGIISDLVLGNILEFKGEEDGKIRLTTPDGREGYVDANDAQELSKWANQAFSTEIIEQTANRMMGSGYLWGGTSTKMTDCSGLTKICYFANGIIIERDASQQALNGEIFPPDQWHSAQLGDLLFFGNAKGRVVHVGIYLFNGEYIHCSGQVKINSLNPQAPHYLSTPLVSISRINGKIGTHGITAIKNHKWYFE